MAGWAALWTLITGIFFLYAIYSIFNPTKFELVSTKKKAIFWAILSPMIWFVGLGILAINDNGVSSIPAPPPEGSIAGTLENAKPETLKAQSRPGVLSVSEDIESIESKNGITTIKLYFKSLWSIEDVYPSASIDMVKIGKYIQSQPAEFGNKIVLEIITDLTSIDGHDSKGPIAQFHYSKSKLLTPNYDNIVYAQILNLSSKHNFFTLEAKTGFHKWCNDKAELHLQICK